MKKNISRVIIPMVMLLIAAVVIAMLQKVRDPGSSAGGNGAAPSIGTRSSDRSTEDLVREGRRKESISLAAQKWYEELLEKYPEMKPVYRDVPDEKNGYLQFILLAESVEKPMVPIDWVNMAFQGDAGWDAAKFKAWLAGNQNYFDEILRIAELPDRSAKGIDLGRFVNGPCRLGGEFSGILLASARVAFESGDQEAALRYMKASGGIGDHLVDIEVPSMLGEIVSTNIREHGFKIFRENFLPALANDPDALGRWNQVMFRDEQPAAGYARAMLGEWHTEIRTFLLPTLLGDQSVEKVLPIRDVTGIIDSYTQAIRRTAGGVFHSGDGRFDVPQATQAFPPSAGLEGKFFDKPGRTTAEDLLFAKRRMAEAFGMNATQTAMNSAAISILLGEEPTVDPVSGEAFAWNAETRTLSAPGKEDVVDSIVLPRQD